MLRARLARLGGGPAAGKRKRPSVRVSGPFREFWLDTRPRLAATKLVTIGFQDRRPGCVNVGHQLRPARVTIGVIPLGESKVADAEVTPIRGLDIDAQTAEQGESVGQGHPQ